MTEIIVEYNPDVKVYHYSNALAKLEITLIKAGIAALKGKADKAEKLMEKAAHQMGKCYEVGEAVGMSHDGIQAIFDVVCESAQAEINRWAEKHKNTGNAQIGIEAIGVKRPIEF